MQFPKLTFDGRNLKHCTVLLLSLWAGLCLTSEFAARYAFPRISRIYRRIEWERKAAHDLSGEQPSILLVGNSLFEKGVIVSAMQQQLPGYEVRRYVISATSALDWYYGLRRLLEEGVHPQTVVAGLSVRQLLAQTIEGGLSVHLLVRTADIESLGRDLQEDNTALSDLYFANLSGFYGGRTQFRKWLLMMMMPDVETLASAITPPSEPYIVNEAMVQVASQKLKAMNDVCAAKGARFILVIPPTRNAQDAKAIAAIQQAGQRVGVTVLSPIGAGELPLAYFADGIHLTQQGAQKFTSTLSGDLRRTLTDATVRTVHSDTKESVAEKIAEQGTNRASVLR